MAKSNNLFVSLNGKINACEKYSCVASCVDVFLFSVKDVLRLRMTYLGNFLL